MVSVTEPAPDLVEACRAQIAACRELAFARNVLQMTAWSSGPSGEAEREAALRRYRVALDAAQAATRVSDAAQAYARSELPDEAQPELPW